MPTLDPWFVENLVDPVDKSKLTFDGCNLVSPRGRSYPVVDGVPVMLLPDERQTMGIVDASLQRSRGNQSVIDRRAEELYLETLGISEEEKQQLVELYRSGSAPIDPVVMVIIGATSGLAYKHLIGNRTLTQYPIPAMRVPQGNGEILLDLGCNWGRWSVAAARKGYITVGLDPSLGAVMAARRVSADLALGIRYVCGDGRNLPFAANTFDCVYSYSVLQHFSKCDTTKTLKEIARTLKRGGRGRIQMANKLGIRSLQHQASRGFKEPESFDVRYYTLWELRRLFQDTIGATRMSADCYFGLGWQMSDYKYIDGKHRAMLLASEALRHLSELIPPMRVVADSIFCDAVKDR